MASRRYNWSIKDMEKALKDLERLINSSTSLKEKNYYSIVRDSLKRQIYNIKRCHIDKKQTILQRLYDSTDAIYTYGTYYSLLSDINELSTDYNNFIIAVSRKLESLSEDGSFDFDQNKKYITHDNVISMVGDFYRSFDSEMSSHYESLLHNKYRTFRFREETIIGTSSCFFVGDNTLFDIANTKGVEKYLSLVHEVGHSYAYSLNKRICYDDNTNLFSEVESTFPEIVAMANGCESDKSLDFIDVYLGNLVPIFSDINYSMVKKAISDEWVSSNYCDSKQLFYKVSDLLDINFDIFKGSLDINLFNTGNYIVSFFISLELLNIYRKDKERAIRLYKEIINMPVDIEYLTYVFSRLEIGKGSLEELDYAKDKITLALKKRGINL